MDSNRLSIPNQAKEDTDSNGCENNGTKSRGASKASLFSNQTTGSSRSELLGRRGTKFRESRRNISHGMKEKAVDTNTEDAVDEELQMEGQLTHKKLKELEQMFAEADEDGGGALDMEEFRNAMRQTMGDHVPDAELDMIFMKVDTNCDGTVDWDEYLNYMLLECREKETMSVQASQPFPKYLRPVKGEHRESIIRIGILPNILSKSLEKTDRIDPAHGRYFTLSTDGTLCYWSFEFHPLATLKVDPPSDKTKSIWVTDAVCLPFANMMVFATTARDLLFFDISANKFERLSRITQLDTCATCLHAWSGGLQHLPFLSWGDGRGGITVLKFNKAPQLTELSGRLRGAKRERIPFCQILQGELEGISGYYLPCIHNDLVREVMYCEHLGCLISCSKDTETAMFVGDLDQKISKYYFKVEKGINSFEYFKRLNVIITGGYDTIVRVWNPYVPAKPIILLRGHQSPILNILVNTKKEYVISVAENKEIRVHDLNAQTCIQTFYRKMVGNLGPRLITGAFFNQYHQVLIVGTTTMAVVEEKNEEIKSQQLVSHGTSISSAIYNPLFNQVISATLDSMILVWNIHTGQKDMQFRAHSGHKNGEDITFEITAITFDPTFRRLITAARDGKVKIWNFNNGACLREMPVFDRCEITGLGIARQFLVTSGWNKRITLFIDDVDDDSVGWLSPSHKEDILTMALYPPHIVATGSYDGDILVWSLETKRILLYLDPRKSKSALSPGAYLATLPNMGSPPVPAENDDDKEEMPLLDKNESLPQTSGTFRRKQSVGKEEEKELSHEIANNTHLAGEQTKTKHCESETIAPEKTNASEAVAKLIFLTARENDPKTATLLASYADGYIRFWSIQHTSGMLGEVFAAHKEGEYVSSMTTDGPNELLITGDTHGYIKVWDISTYCVNCNKVDIVRQKAMQEKIKKFPFVKWKNRLMRATSGVDKLPAFMRPPAEGPTLVNSFQGHLQGITSVAYAMIGEREMIITTSGDCSIRLWLLQGEFMGLFGQPGLWVDQRKFTNAQEARAEWLYSGKPRRTPLLPPDVRRVASATTLQVLNAGLRSSWSLPGTVVKWLGTYALVSKESQSQVNPITTMSMIDNQLGENKQVASISNLDPASTSEILGQSYKRQTKHRPLPKLTKLRQSYNQISVYNSLPYKELDPIPDFDPPDTIVDIKSRNKTAVAATVMNAFRKVDWLVRGANRFRKHPYRNLKYKGSECPESTGARRCSRKSIAGSKASSIHTVKRSESAKSASVTHSSRMRNNAGSKASVEHTHEHSIQKATANHPGISLPPENAQCVLREAHENNVGEDTDEYLGNLESSQAKKSTPSATVKLQSIKEL